ncbi:MAG: DNA-binding response regulator [Chloroflexi bacterium]|nr:DNA-binding response regulator [Chloroflexota bacterium]
MAIEGHDQIGFGEPFERVIRVVIVDDHPMLLGGTERFLAGESGIEVAGTAADGKSAVEVVRRVLPDVLLLDVHLPDISGVEVARQVRSLVPRVAIIVLTGYDDVGYARAMLQLGARGYLRKSATGEEILAAIRTVVDGGTVGLPALAQMTAGLTDESLSDREFEVLRLLALGRRNSQIGEELVLSPKTVEFRVSRLLRKLGVRSRAEAIAKVQRLGLMWLGKDPSGPKEPPTSF